VGSCTPGSDVTSSLRHELTSFENERVTFHGTGDVVKDPICALVDSRKT